MITKWSDCHKVDNKYTEAKFNYVWRIFKIGKYKGQGLKKRLSQNPDSEELALKVRRQEALYSLRR